MCVVLQTTLFTHLQIDGVAPDIGLVAVLAVAYEDGADTGAIFGFIMGLAIDLFLTTPLGLSALSFAVTGYAVGVFQHGVVRTTPWLAPILGGIGGLFGGLVFITAGAIVGQPGFLSFDSLRIVIIASIYDAVIAPAGVPAGAPGGPARRRAGCLAGPRVTPGSGSPSARLATRDATGTTHERAQQPPPARRDRRDRPRPLRRPAHPPVVPPGDRGREAGGGRAAATATGSSTVPAVRGTIYDRNGNVLAQTVPVTTLIVDRQQLSSAERATLRGEPRQAPRHRRRRRRQADRQPAVRAVPPGPGGEEHRA